MVRIAEYDGEGVARNVTGALTGGLIGFAFAGPAGFDEFFNPKKDAPYLAWLLPTGAGTWLRYELSLIDDTMVAFSVGPVRDGANGAWIDDGKQHGAYMTHAGTPSPHGTAMSPELVVVAAKMVPRMVARLTALLAVVGAAEETALTDQELADAQALCDDRVPDNALDQRIEFWITRALWGKAARSTRGQDRSARMTRPARRSKIIPA